MPPTARHHESERPSRDADGQPQAGQPDAELPTGDTRALLDTIIESLPFRIWACDETGRCVGMLSAADFVRREATRGDTTSCVGTRSAGADEAEAALNLPELDTDTVSDHMAAGVQSVSADATLMQAARVMCAAHVHRLPVLDAGGAPVGMMTSLDIVAALVQAMEEAG